jgi:hypothetical protein
MTKWQPIETAPRDETLILGCNPKEGWIETVCWNGHHHFGGTRFPVMFATHWMHRQNLSDNY